VSKLPENMQGLIFRESEKLKIDEAERLLKFNGKFEKFMYWNYDKNPSENDAFRKAFHYLKLAEDVSTLFFLRFNLFLINFHPSSYIPK